MFDKLVVIWKSWFDGDAFSLKEPNESVKFFSLAHWHKYGCGNVFFADVGDFKAQSPQFFLFDIARLDLVAPTLFR